MIFRIVQLTLLSLLMTGVTNSQEDYISSVTYPDTTKQVIIDENIPSVKFANTILADDIKKHLSILASDEYEGRETGKEGNYKAADYIADHFKRLDLPTIGENNTYFQEMAFSFTGWDDVKIVVNDKEYKHLWDFLSFPDRNHDMPLIESDEVIFLGYGIHNNKYSDYEGQNVKGKTLLVYDGEPMNASGESLITGTTELSPWSTNFEYKLKIAKRKGAKNILIIKGDIKEALMANRKFLLGGGAVLGDMSKMDIPYANNVFISTTIAESILGEKKDAVIAARESINSTGKPTTVKIPTNLKVIQDKKLNVLKGYNVMGYVEGSSKKDEIVIVSAHYDHLGKRGDDVYNGADDNGSGSSTVLDIAEAIHLAKENGHGPERSVLFLLVTGEEKGLLGSEFYAENPVFPNQNVVANVNVDMIGREDEKYGGVTDYIYVIGSDRLSTDLHKINEKVNTDYSQLILDYTYNSESDPNRYYYRSDHYNFAKKGIPAIFFFSGVHNDYHRTTDTVDKIIFHKTESIGRHIFHLIWELANRKERIVVDGEVK